MTARLYRDVILWDAEHDAAERCDVRVENGLIETIAHAGSFAFGAAYEGRGKTAMIPGFVNSHGHPAMTILRGLGEELPLMEWLSKRIWPIEDKLDANSVKTGVQLAMLEMLATGTTCFADNYFFEEAAAEAALEGGMRAGLSRGIVENGSGIGDKKLAENLRLAASYNGAKGLINVQLGPHASYTLNFDMMKKTAEAAIEHNLGVQLHWLESAFDWPNTAESKEMSPEEYLEKSGLLEVKHLLLAHCTQMKAEKMPFYARPNITVAHNPKSNLKLGSGIAPIAEMEKAGISLSLGTDGASSNNRLDMWDEMRFAALMQKGKYNDPTQLSAKSALRMATVGGARALGFENTGLLKEGFAADFTLIDLDRPHYVGWTLESLPGCLVYSGSSADVLTTVAAGETLYHRGEYPAMDAAEIVAEAGAARRYLTA